MGEHKLRETKEDNGDEPVKLSTHIVAVLDLLLPCPVVGEAIEDAYQAVADRAKSEDSFILNVVQTVNVYSALDATTNMVEQHLVVTITAQRIARKELEAQQRRQALGGR